MQDDRKYSGHGDLGLQEAETDLERRKRVGSSIADWKEEATGAPFQRGHVAPNRRVARRRRPQGLTANVYSGLLAARKVPE